MVTLSTTINMNSTIWKGQCTVITTYLVDNLLYLCNHRQSNPPDMNIQYHHRLNQYSLNIQHILFHEEKNMYQNFQHL